MSEGARGNRKLILILSALLASCSGGSPPANEANGQNAAAQAPAPRPAAFDWGDPGGEGAGDPQYAGSQALCRQLRTREPSAADRPDAQAAAALRGCDAEALYYGIGVRRDPARARACAFTQAPGHPALEPFAGRAMLMTIYANGTGARRDLDIAIHLACGIAGLAPAEYDARVNHLARLRGAARSGPAFHYCDDIRGGLAEGLCSAHRAALARPQREAALRALIARWTPEERQAFEPLRRAFEEFVAASAAGDLASASLRGRLEQGLRDQFADMLQRMSDGRAPRFTAGQFGTEDLQLNQAYRARLEDERQYDAPGISVASLQNAQRAWLRYRDAFLAFAAVKYPSVRRESLAAWITRNRSEIIPGLNSSL
ncbi:MAG TPA: lysozyme inhibitor LprI family protein [Allosphingosinicella sp.]|nr:lysozyme inhibitor LprI family protein [Allosphingosinicella sp.]